jgi:hypothetical protein
MIAGSVFAHPHAAGAGPGAAGSAPPVKSQLRRSMPPSSRSRPSCSRPPTRGRWGTRSRGRGRRRSPDSEGTSRIRMARAAAPSPSSCNSAELPDRVRCFFMVCLSPRGRLEHTLDLPRGPNEEAVSKPHPGFGRLHGRAAASLGLVVFSAYVVVLPSCIAAVRSPSGRRSGF